MIAFHDYIVSPSKFDGLFGRHGREIGQLAGLILKRGFPYIRERHLDIHGCIKQLLYHLKRRYRSINRLDIGLIAFGNLILNLLQERDLHIEQIRLIISAHAHGIAHQRGFQHFAGNIIVRCGVSLAGCIIVLEGGRILGAGSA